MLSASDWHCLELAMTLDDVAGSVSLSLAETPVWIALGVGGAAIAVIIAGLAHYPQTTPAGTAHPVGAIEFERTRTPRCQLRSRRSRATSSAHTGDRTNPIETHIPTSSLARSRAL